MNNMISIDHTLLIQLINFIVTIIVLNYILIKPIRAQISKRKEIMDTFSSDISKLKKTTQDKLDLYEDTIAATKSKAIHEREALQLSAKQDEKDIIQNAQNRAKEFIISSQEEINKESKEAIEKLYDEINAFANKSVAKIIQ